MKIKYLEELINRLYIECIDNVETYEIVKVINYYAKINGKALNYYKKINATTLNISTLKIKIFLDVIHKSYKGLRKFMYTLDKSAQTEYICIRKSNNEIKNLFINNLPVGYK